MLPTFDQVDETGQTNEKQNGVFSSLQQTAVMLGLLGGAPEGAAVAAGRILWRLLIVCLANRLGRRLRRKIVYGVRTRCRSLATRIVSRRADASHTCRVTVGDAAVRNVLQTGQYMLFLQIAWQCGSIRIRIRMKKHPDVMDSCFVHEFCSVCVCVHQSWHTQITANSGAGFSSNLPLSPRFPLQ